MQLILKNGVPKAKEIRKLFNTLPEEYLNMQCKITVYGRKTQVPKERRKETAFGQFMPIQNKIEIFAYKTPKKMDKDMASMGILAAIFHEVRHRWQLRNMDNYLELLLGYISPLENEQEYENQELEVDANKFMLEQMDRLGFLPTSS